MPVTLMAWKAVKKNTLRGFAKIRLGKSLIINDVPVNNFSGRAVAGMPSKPIIDQHGTHKKDEAGKAQYARIIEWTDKDAADRFSESVIAAIEHEYPGSTS